MKRAKIYQAVGLKRTFGLFFSAVALLSAGCTDEDIAGEDWHSRPKNEAIEFKDSRVLEILLQNGVDTNGDGEFSISSSVIIYVPTASVEAYKSATGWSRYADMIVGYDF